MERELTGRKARKEAGRGQIYAGETGSEAGMGRQEWRHVEWMDLARNPGRDTHKATS